MDDPYNNFVPPPEAPVFTPTEEEFADPLGYIAKIRPIAVKTGICKIKPPPDWQPPFAVDVEKFRFVPRVQRLNELEAKSRIKLNFLDRLAKFWELQGCTLRIPHVERKLLDLFSLYKFVEEEGGMDIVSNERKWSKISTKLGMPTGKGCGSIVRGHYERILYPFHVFKKGDAYDFDKYKKKMEVEKEEDQEYKPHGGAGKETAAQLIRKSKRALKEEALIDYSANSELKKLQFYGAGPKAAVPSGNSNVKEEKPAEKVKDEKIKTRERLSIPGSYADVSIIPDSPPCVDLDLT